MRSSDPISRSCTHPFEGKKWDNSKRMITRYFSGFVTMPRGHPISHRIDTDLGRDHEEDPHLDTNLIKEILIVMLFKDQSAFDPIISTIDSTLMVQDTSTTSSSIDRQKH